MHAQILIGEKCPMCSKFRSPSEILRMGEGECVRICLDCYAWHRRALDMLAGTPPPGCQVCGVSFEEAKARDGNSRMWLHQKDGIYQILCGWCDAKYVQKRRDLYGNTPYGKKKKL